MIRALICIIVCHAIISYSAHADPDIDMNFLIAGAEFGDNVLTNCAGSVTYYSSRDFSDPDTNNIDRNNMRNTEKATIQLAVDGIKIKIGKNMHYAEDYPVYKIMIFNGEATREIIYHHVNTPQQVIYGNIFQENKLNKEVINPLYYAWNILGTPVASFLQGNPLKDNAFIPESIQSAGTCVIDNLTCHHIKATSENGHSVSVWICPDRLFRPKKIEYNYGSGMTVFETDFLDKAGTFVPSRILMKLFIWNDETGKMKLHAISETEYGDDFTYNTIINNDTFQYDFPLGIKLFDHRTNETNIVEY